MNSNEEIFKALRESLAELYFEERERIRILDEAGIDKGRIQFSGRALNDWHDILNHAIGENKLDQLLAVIDKDIGQENPGFQSVYGTYLHFVKSGETLQRLAQEQLSGQPGSLLYKLLARVESTRWKLSESKKARLELRKISADIDLLGELQSLPSIEARLTFLDAKSTDPYKIIEIFNGARELLILGEPGSGKSFTLWELTRDLIILAQQDSSRPIPVYLPLASWTPRQSILEWIAHTIGDIYRFGFQLSSIETWLKDHQLILLLDGLDEVAEDYRTACVRAINQLGQEVGWEKIVVSCRTEIYQELVVVEAGLRFSNMIILCPLNLDEIDTYFSQIGLQTGFLRDLLEHELVLRTPLMLWVMSNIDDQGIEQLRYLHDNTIRKAVLFDAFIRQMLKRKRNPGELDIREVPHSTNYGQKRTVAWLRSIVMLVSTWFDDKQPYTELTVKYRLQWLAKQMRSNYFFIEKLQPTWLSSTDLPLYIFGSRIITGFLLGVIIAFGLKVTEFIHYPVIGLTGGLVIGFIDYFRLVKLAKDKIGNLSNLRQFFYGLVMTLLVSIAIALIFGMWVKDPASDTFGILSSSGLKLSFIGIFFGLTFGVWGQNNHLSEDIQNIERLDLSIKRFSYGFIASGLPFTIFLALLCWIMVQTEGNSVEWLLDRSQQFSSKLGLHHLGQPWSAVLFGSIFGIFVGGTVSGTYLLISPKQTDEQRSQKLQAIMRSNFQITFLFSLIFGTIWSLVFLMIFENADSEVILRSFRSGLTLGLISFFWQGGYDFVKHYWLRFILYGQGYLPLRSLDKFLDYCQSLIFLEKYPAYKFMHKDLQEHFATLPVLDQEIAKTNRNKIISAVTCIFVSLGLIILLISLTYPKLIFKLQAWYLPNAQYRQTIVSTENRHNNANYEPLSIITGRPVQSIKVNTGDYVRVVAGGRLSTGPFVVRANPNGSVTGILGIPIDDFYDRIPKFRNGALMFHIVDNTGAIHFVSDNEYEVDCATYFHPELEKVETWCLCGFNAQFTSSTTGMLEFQINDTEPVKHAGAFYVTIKIESAK